MTDEITSDDARDGLATIERSHRRVLAEVDLPRWYWWGLAAGWVALGIVADLRHPVVTTIATVLLGAVHAAVATRVLDGRRRTAQLAVRVQPVTRRLSMIMIAVLVALVVVTVVGALAISADGADHPATIASVGAALIIALGGPQLPGLVLRRAVPGTPAR